MTHDDHAREGERQTGPAGATPSPIATPVRTSDAQEHTSSDSPERIRMEIAETRVEMTETVDAIQGRLSPDTLAEQAKAAISDVTEHAVQTVKVRAQEAIHDITQTARDATVGKAEHMVSNATETARDTGASLLDTVKENPVQAAVAVASIGWLLSKRSSSGSSRPSQGSFSYNRAGGGGYRYDDTYGSSRGHESDAEGSHQGTLSQVSERVGDTAQQARHITGQAVSTAGDAIGGVASRAGRTSKDVGSTIIETITENPIPAALAGVGLAWLWMSREQSQEDEAWERRSRYGNGYASAFAQADEDSGGIANQAQERAGQVAEQIQERAGDLAGGAQDQARRAQRGLDRMLHEHPVAVGVMASAIGAAIGLALPDTEPENRMLGEAREQVMEQAKETAQQISEKAQHVAHEAQSAAQKAASE